MNTLSEFKIEFEREMLIKIIIGLRYGKISNEQAQQLAGEYLMAVREENAENILSKIYTMAGTFNDILELYIRLASKHFTEKKEQILTQAREYMNIQQYDVALNVLKGACLPAGKGN